MTSILANRLFTSIPAMSGWPVSGLIRAMLSSRREIMKISALARRERIQLGYQRVPQRVWDRRSALFVDISVQ